MQSVHLTKGNSQSPFLIEIPDGMVRFFGQQGARQVPGNTWRALQRFVQRRLSLRIWIICNVCQQLSELYDLGDNGVIEVRYFVPLVHHRCSTSQNHFL